MKGPIPAVDAEDFKKCWELRRELEGGSIDLELFRSLCKPTTDAFASGIRASCLLTLIQLAPPELASHIQDGAPSDALLKAFAQMPLEAGKPLSGQELLRFCQT